MNPYAKSLILGISDNFFNEKIADQELYPTHPAMFETLVTLPKNFIYFKYYAYLLLLIISLIMLLISFWINVFDQFGL